jgi:hypothetical protein
MEIGGYATPRPLYPRQTDPVPIAQEAVWAPQPVWTGTRNSNPPGFDPPTVQEFQILNADILCKTIC